MERLLEIKRRIDEIGEALNAQYPRYRSDARISKMITELKEYTQAQEKAIKAKEKRDELTEFEQKFIAPGISDVYTTSIDRLNKGARPSEQVNMWICDSLITIEHWLNEINKQ